MADVTVERYNETHLLVSNEEYAALVADSKFLSNLHDAGVDNWDGYHYGFGNDEDEDR